MTTEITTYKPAVEVLERDDSCDGDCRVEIAHRIGSKMVDGVRLCAYRLAVDTNERIFLYRETEISHANTVYVRKSDNVRGDSHSVSPLAEVYATTLADRRAGFVVGNDCGVQVHFTDDAEEAMDLALDVAMQSLSDRKPVRIADIYDYYSRKDWLRDVGDSILSE